MSHSVIGFGFGAPQNVSLSLNMGISSQAFGNFFGASMLMGQPMSFCNSNIGGMGMSPMSLFSQMMPCCGMQGMQGMQQMLQQYQQQMQMQQMMMMMIMMQMAQQNQSTGLNSGYQMPNYPYYDNGQNYNNGYVDGYQQGINDANNWNGNSGTSQLPVYNPPSNHPPVHHHHHHHHNHNNTHNHDHHNHGQTRPFHERLKYIGNSKDNKFTYNAGRGGATVHADTGRGNDVTRLSSRGKLNATVNTGTGKDFTELRSRDNLRADVSGNFGSKTTVIDGGRNVESNVRTGFGDDKTFIKAKNSLYADTNTGAGNDKTTYVGGKGPMVVNHNSGSGNDTTEVIMGKGPSFVNVKEGTGDDTTIVRLGEGGGVVNASGGPNGLFGGGKIFGKDNMVVDAKTNKNFAIYDGDKLVYSSPDYKAGTEGSTRINSTDYEKFTIQGLKEGKDLVITPGILYGYNQSFQNTKNQ